jgi:hypothetical protein
MGDAGGLILIGRTTDSAVLEYAEAGEDCQIPLADLTAAWRGTLDW